MATWTTNPTITNTTSSAATLNIWRENAQYIYDLLPKVGPVFSRLRHAGSGLTQGNNLWTIPFRRHRYLHYRVVVSESDIDAEIAIYVNGEKVSLETGGAIPPATWSGSIDLEALTSTPDLGDEYDIWVDCDLTDTGIIVVEYLFEYPTAA